MPSACQAWRLHSFSNELHEFDQVAKELIVKFDDNTLEKELGFINNKDALIVGLDSHMTVKEHLLNLACLFATENLLWVKHLRIVNLLADVVIYLGVADLKLEFLRFLC